MKSSVISKETIKKNILNNKKTQGVYDFLMSQKILYDKIFVTFECGLMKGEIPVPVRNSKCLSIDCVWDIDAIVNYISAEATEDISQKCPTCSKFIYIRDYYVDIDMDAAQKNMKKNHSDVYFEICNGIDDWQVFVTRKNQWNLEQKDDAKKHFIIKESEMLNEYEKNYPQYPSKQTAQFYSDKWVFINENVNVQNNGKLQSILYLFFPSLANSVERKKAWKEVHIFVDKKTNVQSYFNEYMTVCKYFNPLKNENGILASGGLGYPEKQNYVNRAFIVPLFQDDPEKQIQGQIDLVAIEPMTQPRVFHQLVQYRNSIYAIGGYIRDIPGQTDTPTKTCERFNFSTNKWEKLPDISTPRQLFTVTVYLDKLYIIGGKVNNPGDKEDKEDLTIEIFDGDTTRWTSYNVFNKPNPDRYFTERAYAFVKENNTLVVFGGRKEKIQYEYKPNQRSRQAVELNLQNGQYRQTNDLLPEQGIQFDAPTDFKGILYNNRFIFGFKRYIRENNMTILCPSICKYDLQGANKFSFESWKKIPM